MGLLSSTDLIWSSVKVSLEERWWPTFMAPTVVLINHRKDVGGGYDSMSQEIMLTEPGDSDTATVTAGWWTQRGLSEKYFA